MGRFQRKNRKKKESKANQEGKGDTEDGKKRQDARDGDGYVKMVVDQGNFKMEAYYAAQRLHHRMWTDMGDLKECTSFEDFNKERLLWRSHATETLPASFRIAKDMPECLRERVLREMDELLSKVGDESEQVIKKLPFLSNAYQLKVDRATIRKDPNLTNFHEWMKQQSLAGFITRQETVSMVPAVVLAPQPTDCVLDMCAAPGSKTSQLLENLNSDGSLVANDNNPRRAHMLVSQLKRIMHMNPVTLITCCDGQLFPSKILQFDRVLCDVPCTGDGTSRKNIQVWKGWTQVAALSIHKVQLQIAWKGAAQLLKVGGTLCYSTCSNNPIENEAVVAELIRKSNGALELVPLQLDGFRVRPGWSTWKVFTEPQTQKEKRREFRKNSAKMQAKKKEFEGAKEPSQEGKSEEENTPTDGEVKQDSTTCIEGKEDSTGVALAEQSEETKKDPPLDDNGQSPSKRGEAKRYKPEVLDDEHLIELAKSAGLLHFESYEDMPEKFQHRIKPSMFPPTNEELDMLHLDRCVRCLPQDNNTGGFFVALIRKVAPLSVADRNAEEVVEPSKKRVKVDEGDSTPLEPDGKEAVKMNCVKDEKGNYVADLGKDDFIPVRDDIMETLVETFGLTGEGFSKDLIMTRASGDSKILYLISRPIKSMIDKGIQKRVTVVHSGLKAFSRSSLDGAQIFRLCQDSAHFLAPFMEKRKIHVGLDDFEKCLSDERFVDIADFSEAVQPQVRELDLGSFLFILDGYEDERSHKMIITLWRCRTERVDKLVGKVERDAIASKLSAIRGKSKGS